MNDQPALPEDVDRDVGTEPPRPKHQARPDDPGRWVVESDSVAQAETLDDRDRDRPRSRLRLHRPQTDLRATNFDHASSGEPDAGGVDQPGVDQPGVDQPGVDHGDAVGKWREQSKRRKKKRPFWVELPILIVIAFALTFLIQTFIAKVYYVPSGSMEKTLHGVQSGGDRILASKIVYDFRDPHQGDIVVFKGPDTWAPEADIAGPSSWVGKIGQALGSVVGVAPPNEKDFVKRVVAVGGQTVACCDAKGNVTVDRRPLNEPYLYEPWAFAPGDPAQDCTVSPDGQTYASQRCFAPFKVPAGQLWVMGDHRSESADSSYYCWGKTAAGEKTYRASSPTGEDCNRPIPADNVIGKAIVVVMPPSRWGTIGDPDIDPGNPALGAGPVAALPLAGGVLVTAGLRGGLALGPARRRRRLRGRTARLSSDRWLRSGRPARSVRHRGSAGRR